MRTFSDVLRIFPIPIIHGCNPPKLFFVPTVTSRLVQGAYDISVSKVLIRPFLCADISAYSSFLRVLCGISPLSFAITQAMNVVRMFSFPIKEESLFKYLYPSLLLSNRKPCTWYDILKVIALIFLDTVLFIFFAFRGVLESSMGRTEAGNTLYALDGRQIIRV